MAGYKNNNNYDNEDDVFEGTPQEQAVHAIVTGDTNDYTIKVRNHGDIKGATLLQKEITDLDAKRVVMPEDQEHLRLVIDNVDVLAKNKDGLTAIDIALTCGLFFAINMILAKCTSTKDKTATIIDKETLSRLAKVGEINQKLVQLAFSQLAESLKKEVQSLDDMLAQKPEPVPAPARKVVDVEPIPAPAPAPAPAAAPARKAGAETEFDRMIADLLEPSLQKIKELEKKLAQQQQNMPNDQQEKKIAQLEQQVANLHANYNRVVGENVALMGTFTADEALRQQLSRVREELSRVREELKAARDENKAQAEKHAAELKAARDNMFNDLQSSMRKFKGN